MLRVITKPDLSKERMIQYKLTVRAPRPRVFDALTVRTLIDEWGGGPARVQAKIHGEISFWDGDMYGSIREVETPYHLVHTLQHISWQPRVADSLVVWKLEEVTNGTVIWLEHRDLPNRKLRDLQDERWAASFLGPLKAYIEGHPNDE